MKTIKSLLLGATAAFTLGTVATAADLPAAEPVEYVKICDAYGAGYFFIPGTDTCLRISGYVRFQTFVSGNSDSSTTFDGDLGGLRAPTRAADGTFTEFNSLTTDNYDMWTRGLLRVDARTRTEMGVLRSFIEWAAGGDNGASVQQRYAFVQFGVGGGVVTAGLTDSFMSFTDYGTVFGTPVGTPDGTTRRNVLAYSASFGNGISATVAIEDSQIFGGGGSTTNLLFTDGAVRRRIEMPDLVGSIRVQQSWGVAQLSATVGQQKFVDTGCITPAGTVTCTFDEVGYAIRGGLRLNLDMLARGSNFSISAAYADGMIQHLGGGFAGVNKGFYQTSFANGVDNENGLESVTGWSVFAHFQHFFTPALRASIFGGYGELDYGLSAGTIALAGVTSGIVDRAYSFGGNVMYSPVRNLDLGVEVFYTNARYTYFDSATGSSTKTDTDGWGAIFRIQRSF